MNSPLHAFVWLAVIAVYFMPAIIAWTRPAPHRILATAINTFAGWTIVGWIVAMVMAFRSTHANCAAHN